MTYIVVSENEIVKAEMAVPDCWGWSGPNPMECKKCIKFQAHCLSLPRIPIEGKHKWEVWQSVPESEFTFKNKCKYDGACLKERCLFHPCDEKITVAIPIQPTPEPVKIKNMTITEKKQPSFGVNDDVYILDTQIYDTPTWIHGVVEEVGDESILVKWDDLEDPTEYQISDMPDIRHREPTPEGEKVDEKFKTGIERGLNGWQVWFEIGVQTFSLQPVSPELGHELDTEDRAKWYEKNLRIALNNLLTNDNTQTNGKRNH